MTRSTVPSDPALARFDERRSLWLRPGTLDEYVAKELKNYACLEPTRGDVLLDVGANIGTVVRWARSLGARVIAVEPEPDNFAMLSRNSPCGLYNVRAAVVSDYRGSVTLYVNGGTNKGLHSTTPHRGREEVLVPAIHFGRLLARGVNKLKVDCEGAEYDLLFNTPLPSTVTHLAMEYHLTKPEWRSDGPRLHEHILSQGLRVVRAPRFGEKNWATFAAYVRPR